LGSVEKSASLESLSLFGPNMRWMSLSSSFIDSENKLKREVYSKAILNMTFSKKYLPWHLCARSFLLWVSSEGLSPWELNLLSVGLWLRSLC